MAQIAQRFGGGWTRQKLDVVENYLVAYTRVMQKQTNFRTWYFDGFAGSGFIDILTGAVDGAVAAPVRRCDVRLSEAGDGEPEDRFRRVSFR